MKIEMLMQIFSSGTSSLPPTFPFLFNSENLPIEWLVKYESNLSRMSEHLQQRKEEIRFLPTEKSRLAASILSWSEFTELARTYNIPAGECDTLAVHLRNLSIIHHFRDFAFPHPDSYHQASNFIFLLPEM